MIKTACFSFMYTCETENRTNISKSKFLKQMYCLEKNTTSRMIWKIAINLRNIKVQAAYKIYKLFTWEK